MTWVPNNISATCQAYPTSASCQMSMLTFVAFLVQNLGKSFDENFTDNKINTNIENEEYDFIIVGGGAAGCVVANRLSEIQQWKVLLLEAGDEEPIVADVPAFYNLLLTSSLDWKYQTEPQKYACSFVPGKTCPYSRGKVLGGSTVINGMMYVRGNPKNYDHWASLGNSGWSYEEILPYFLKSEDNQVYKNSTFHSTGGYLTVDFTNINNVDNDILPKAWKELGYSAMDYNGYQTVGIAEYQLAVKNGARLSTNGAFLRPIRGKRANLTIKTNVLVTKVLIHPRTKRAYGVEYSLSGDRKNLKQVYAKKEVIISAGVMESPKLLMLSGIGHANELQKSGIKVIKNLPVGDNLQDHVYVISSVGIYNTSSNYNGNTIIDDVVYWQTTHAGPLTKTTALRTGVFEKFLDRSDDVPNIQIVYAPSIIESIKLSKSYYGLPTYIPTAYSDSVIVGSLLISPKSRGTIRLNSSNPTWSQPLIQPNYLTHQKDIDILVAAALSNKDIFNTRAFKDSEITKYTTPPELCKEFEFESKQFFECVVKKYSMPGLHAVGTCKMGPINDFEAVVDPRLRVYGIKGLRVIDASIMPSIPSGNTFAPVVMIGEKGSDLIKQDWIRSRN